MEFGFGQGWRSKSAVRYACFGPIFRFIVLKYQAGTIWRMANCGRHLNERFALAKACAITRLLMYAAHAAPEILRHRATQD